MRRELAAFLEKLSELPASLRASAPYVGRVLETVIALCGDASEKVAKRGLMAASVLFSSISKACIERRQMQTIWDSWAALSQLQDCACKVLQSPSAKGGHKVHSIKLLESMVLFYCDKEFAWQSGEQKDGKFASQLKSKLKAASDAIFLASKSLVPVDTLPGPVAIVLLNALGALAKGQPALFARHSCDFLVGMANALGNEMAGPNTKFTALLQTLKQVLLSLLKTDSLVQYGVHEICFSAMENIGFDEVAGSLKRQALRKQQARDRFEGTQEPAAKRPKVVDALDADTLLSQFRRVAKQVSDLLGSSDELNFEGLAGVNLSAQATADAVISNFGFDVNSYIHDAIAVRAGEVGFAKSASEALTEANQASVKSISALTKDDMKMISMEALKRVFAASLEYSTHGAGSDVDVTFQDVTIARMVAVVLSTLLKLETQYCEDMINAVIAHTVDKMQRERGHGVAVILFYTIFAMGSKYRDMYKAVFVKLLRAMRDGLPPHDGAICKLMKEVPFLPAKEAVDFLKGLFEGPADKEQDEEFLEWASLGLNTIHELVFARPKLRRIFLNLSLSCAMNANPELRSKAIKLIANDLYPVAHIQGDIESFALKALQQLTTAQNITAGEVSRHMELFFALCSKKHDLLHELLSLFARSQKLQQQVMSQNVPKLAKLIPPTSTSLLDVIESPPPGSEVLLLLMLHTMAQESRLPPRLVKAVENLHDQTGDSRLLVPIFADMPKANAMDYLPKLVQLPETALKSAIVNAFSKDPNGRTPGSLAASDLLVGIHLVDERLGVPLKKLIECTNLCFQMKDIFTPKVLSIAIQHLIQQTPLPKLFMRTVIQTTNIAPQLKGFVVDLLAKLVGKKIWNDRSQWQGFLMCAKLTAPASYAIVMQLPVPSLQDALRRMPDLQQPLREYVQAHNASNFPKMAVQALSTT